MTTSRLGRAALALGVLLELVLILRLLPAGAYVALGLVVLGVAVLLLSHPLLVLAVTLMALLALISRRRWNA